MPGVGRETQKNFELKKKIEKNDNIFHIIYQIKVNNVMPLFKGHLEFQRLKCPFEKRVKQKGSVR